MKAEKAMSIEVKIPDVGESIQEVQIAQWLKQEGDAVREDENLVELDTDKASLDLPAPADGVLKRIVKQDGESVAVGEVIAYLEASDDGAKNRQSGANVDRKQSSKHQRSDETTGGKRQKNKDKQTDMATNAEKDKQPPRTGKAIPVTPAARRELRRFGLQPEDVEAQGRRLRPEDVRRHVERQEQQAGTKVDEAETDHQEEHTVPETDFEVAAREEVVPMSLIRRRIGHRLVEAQQTAALLTTFNEIDMSAVVQLRQTHGERFHERYGVKLGFMSFFVKAVIDALKQQPELNAEVREESKIVYRHDYHIGVAIGSDRGLVVPVLRHADRLSFAEVEQAIGDFARRAGQNKLRPQELEEGTFTISNGGVYGSLLSTPIVNPPQSGVLGMHAIQDRPVAREGQVVVRPMMYVALTYDHRIVDGREAVLFLRRIKEAVEEPSRMLMEV